MQTIALSMRMVKADNGEWRDVISQNWSRYLHAQNLRPVLVPNDPDHCTQYLDGVSALILTGGDAIVLQKPGDKSDDPLARRDYTESRLLEEALRRSLPVLGICRGLEFLHWYHGGTLEHFGPDEHLPGKEHDVQITENPFTDIFAPGTLRVNSFHRLRIGKGGKELQPFATAFDGSVEGLFLPGKPVIAVMWHPERAFQDGHAQTVHKNLVSRFLAAVR